MVQRTHDGWEAECGECEFTMKLRDSYRIDGGTVYEFICMDPECGATEEFVEYVNEDSSSH